MASRSAVFHADSVPEISRICRYDLDYLQAISYDGRVGRPSARSHPRGRSSHTSRWRTDVTIELSTTDKRDGEALALFARCAEWQTGHTKDGRPFFAIPGSEAGLLHMTDQRDCSCQDRQRSRNVCKHMRAVRLWMAAFATGAVAPKPRPGATAEDDRVALTPAGAAHLAEQYERSEAVTPTAYATLYPTCRVQGCQDD